MARQSVWVLLLWTMTTWAEDGLVFDREYLNLGKLEAAGDLTEVFPFHVAGNREVEILDLQASCGCIAPSIAKRRYGPGERDKLVFGIHATSQEEGKKRHQVSLTYRPRGGDVVTVPIIIDLELFKPIVVEPATLLLHVNGDKPMRQTIKVSDKRPLPLELREVLASSSRLRPKVLSSRVNDPFVRQVELTIDGNFPIGKTEERIVIRTADAKHGELVVPVTVVHSSRLKVLPEALHGNAKGGQGPSWVVLVSDARGEEIEIADVQATSPAIRVDFPREATRRCRLAVKVDPAGMQGKKEGEIVLHVVKPISTTLTLPVRIEY